MAKSDNRDPRRAGIEGRTHKRFRFRDRKVMRFAVRPSFQNAQALVHDVSVNGIGFILNTPLERGATIALQLQGGRPGTSLVRTAKVVHVRRHLPVDGAPWSKKKPLFKVLMSIFGGKSGKPADEEFVYLIGCRFNPPLSLEELQELTEGLEA